MTEKTWVSAVNVGVSPEEPRPHLYCERCGTRLVVESVVPVDVFVKTVREFIDEHRSCALREDVTGAIRGVTGVDAKPLEAPDVCTRSESLAAQTLELGEAADAEVGQ